MLRTRLWMGALLIGLILAVLLLDQRWAPWYPCLLILVLILAVVSAMELQRIVPSQVRPQLWLCCMSVALVAASSWAPLLHARVQGSSLRGEPWVWITGGFGLVVLTGFLVEMARFREPNGAVPRLAMLTWMTAYLGLLPSFLIQLRWLPELDGENGSRRSAAALALTIFVPKCCDIGAYFTGRSLGKHRMAPVLSPKKTWEGAVGGLVSAMIVALAIHAFTPVIADGVGEVALLGLALGVAGMLGDLAESMIKRDCAQKDASQLVPGFGGVLDVIDSILFAAPVAYLWLH